MTSDVTGQHATCKVLIVEDDDLNMTLVNDVLEVYGYETLQAKNGREALLSARQHRPDLILMDIDLPEMSGMEATKRLKADEELRNIPVIAVTALAMRGDEEMIRKAGCQNYISKPFSIAKLIQAVEHYCGGC